MANPKRKSSKARTSKRRATFYNSLKKPELMECPNCGSPKQMHRVCATCGYYRGRQITEGSDIL